MKLQMSMKIRSFFLSVVMLLCWMVPASAITLQEAKKYIDTHDYEKAVHAFRTLMQQPANAKNAECNKYFGQALCLTGAYEESIRYLQAGAKGNKSGSWYYLGISRQHLYDFEGAIEALEKYQTYCSPGSVWMERTDSIIAECRIGLKGVNHVQDVVIMDSLLVSEQAFFLHYKLGNESGRMLTAAACGEMYVRMTGKEDAPVFENQAGDYRLFMAEDEEGWHLYEIHRFNDEWDEPSLVASLEADGNQMCYPFMRSDSETLYFSMDKTPGFGGFDLYKTHYNREEEEFYTPERLGMPFNSPFNDYMMAIDETHQAGWWATDRNAPKGMICIYIFQLEEEPEYLEEENPERARIDAVAASWRKAEGYAAEMQQILTAPQQMVVKSGVTIPISNRLTYTSAEDFRSDGAREAYEQALQLENELDLLLEETRKMRDEWRGASAQRRQELRPSILSNEKRELQLRRQIQEARKQYRNLEIVHTL